MCIFSQVRAEDKDPPEHGGTLRYEFVMSSGEKNKFTIDSEKGIIKTLTVSVNFCLLNVWKNNSRYDVIFRRKTTYVYNNFKYTECSDLKS